jgi:hypothetical protein
MPKRGFLLLRLLRGIVRHPLWTNMMSEGFTDAGFLIFSYETCKCFIELSFLLLLSIKLGQRYVGFDHSVPLCL